LAFLQGRRRRIVRRAPCIRKLVIALRIGALLNREGFHVALLQTRQKLVEGDEFQCSVSFRRAGIIQVQVRVSQKGAK
jgi:copper(I)-binding protein